MALRDLVKHSNEDLLHFHCDVCNKQVECVGIELKVETMHSWTGMSRMVHTGEKIVTVKCHGEEIVISNWRGIISETRQL